MNLRGPKNSGKEKFGMFFPEFFVWLEWLFNNDCLLDWLVRSLVKREEKNASLE
jgi:hypothetical protein